MCRQLVVSEKSGEALMLIRSDTKELVCLADDDNFQVTLNQARPVRGVVEDGRTWVHAGVVYECVKGARVMVREGYARGCKSAFKGCLQQRDGARVVGMLEHRIRVGEWAVRFPGAGPLLHLPVGIHGQYSLQYVDPSRWAARQHKYGTHAGGDGDGGKGGESHPAPPHWGNRSLGVLPGRPYCLNLSVIA
jgi:hypothetical protein